MLSPYQTPPWRMTNWSFADKREYEGYQSRVLSRFIKEQVYPHASYYRRLFDAAGLRPEDIQGIEDLAKIPLSGKENLVSTADNPDRPKDFVIRPPRLAEFTEMDPERRTKLYHDMTVAERNELDRLLWEYMPTHANHTTGRSAAPTPVWMSRRDLYDYVENMRRGFDTLKVDPLGLTMSLYPFTPSAHQAFWYLPIMSMGTGAPVLNTGGGKAAGTDKILQMVEQYQPKVLTIMPGYTFHLLRKAEAAGTRFTNLEIVSISGEKCTNEMRAKIIEGFASRGADPKKLKVIVSYGSTEMRGGLNECAHGADGLSSTWYHSKPDFYIFEIVDPDTGEVLPEGETGEIVFTALDTRGTAFVRYRTADIAVGGITTKVCPACGATVPRISNELKRVSNLKSLNLTKLKGNLVDLGSFTPLLIGLPELQEFQVELKKHDDDPFGMDEVFIHAAIKPDANEKKVEDKIRRTLKDKMELEPNQVNFMPLAELLNRLGMETELKEARLVDNRPQETKI